MTSSESTRKGHASDGATLPSARPQARGGTFSGVLPIVGAVVVLLLAFLFNTEPFQQAFNTAQTSASSDVSSTGTSDAFLAAVKTRRSIYTITSESPIPDDKVVQIVPTPSNTSRPPSTRSRPACAVVLFGDAHQKLWQIVLHTLKPKVSPEQYEMTEAKVTSSFAAGHGTVLFFEDSAPVTALQTAYPSYADKFPGWAQHTSGMLQFIVWTTLENEGLGASLQHYAPLITPQVLAAWGLPDTWELVAQMPFGTPSAPPGEKTFSPVEDRIKFSVYRRVSTAWDAWRSPDRSARSFEIEKSCGQI
ncbi:Nitroreductase-like protein [Epithele typhae]|uniref:Nitroreductase-like protein n=1 Tax=Epithele typhae TaxID=378194 RepID=UPI00200759C5|nr:Nitroreductase-like protein [Epithele typhae]KAH9913092.1 Nitroreductase-like protein [Epithele typhae]